MLAMGLSRQADAHPSSPRGCDTTRASPPVVAPCDRYCLSNTTTSVKACPWALVPLAVLVSDLPSADTTRV